MAISAPRLALIASLSLAQAGPANALESIREERGREWALSCTQDGGKDTRVCLVRTDIGGVYESGLECSFTVVVAARRSFLRTSCNLPMQRLDVAVSSGSSGTLAPASGPDLTVDGGDARLVADVIGALQLEQRKVSMTIHPVEGESLSLTLGSKDFDRMYGQALVVSDQVL